MEIQKKTLCITQNRSIVLQTEKHTSRGRATGSGGKGKQQSQNPHHNHNSHQISGQNRQRLEVGRTQSGALRVGANMQNSSGVVSHSTAHRGNGSGGGKGSGGQGGGGKGGAHQVARQSSTKQAVTIAAHATLGAWGPDFSFTFRGSSKTSATHGPGAPNQHRSSNQCSAHISLGK